MITTTLGAEFDAMLRGRAVSILKTLGAKKRGGWWGVGGSQEIARTEFVWRGHEVALEDETYVGLTLSGPSELVDQVVARLE